MSTPMSPNTPAIGIPRPNLREVRPIEAYKHYSVAGVPMYVCREVQKTSSKGKPEPRVLVVNAMVMWLGSTTTKKVHRLIQHGTIKKIRVQRGVAGNPKLHLVMDPETHEPDILLQQSTIAENRQFAIAEDGTDVVRVLQEIHLCISGEPLPVEELDPTVDLSERTCSLKKVSGYAAPKWKIHRGDLKRPLSPGSPGSPGSSPAGSPHIPTRRPSTPTGTPIVRPPGPPPAAVAPVSVTSLTPAAAPATVVSPPSIHAASARPVVPPPLLKPEQQPPPPGSRRYVVNLTHPEEELGFRYRSWADAVRVIGIFPGGPWARSGVPLGLVHSCNGFTIGTIEDLRHALRDLRSKGQKQFPVVLTPDADEAGSERVQALPPSFPSAQASPQIAAPAAAPPQALTSITSAPSSRPNPPPPSSGPSSGFQGPASVLQGPASVPASARPQAPVSFTSGVASARVSAPASVPASVRPQGPPPSASVVTAKALVIGASYAGTQYILVDAPGHAASFADLLKRRGAVAPEQVRMLLETPSATAESLPNYANIVQGLDWLVSDAAAGCVRYLVFVGHGMNQRDRDSGSRRDGPGEAIYPSDFQAVGRRVVPQDDVVSALSRLPPGVSVIAACDCAASGTFANLPYKLVTGESGTSEQVSRVNPPVARVVSFSLCRDKATDEGVSCSGLLSTALLRVLGTPGPEPSVAAVLTEIRSAVEAEVGLGGPLPLVSSSVPLNGGDAPAGWFPPGSNETDPIAFTPRAGKSKSPHAEHQQQYARHVIRLSHASEALGVSYARIGPAPGDPNGIPGPLALSGVDGAAARAGFLVPSVIISVGGYGVRDVEQLQRAEKAWRRTGSLECEVVTAPMPEWAAQTLSYHSQQSGSAFGQQELGLAPPLNVVLRSTALSTPPHVQPPRGVPPAAPLSPTVALQTLQGPPTLPPEELTRRIPALLNSPGFARMLSVRRHNGVPEVFFTAEVAVLELRPPTPDVAPAGSPPVLWPAVKQLVLGRHAMYVSEPSGDLDRCVSLSDIYDFVLLKGGAVISDGSKGPVQALPGPPDSPWLAVRIPSQYDLLLQPTPSTQSPSHSVQELLQVVNVLLQQDIAAPPARVLVVEQHPAAGLLQLRRPAAFSYPWIPLHVRIYPDPVAGSPAIAGPAR
eukprot:Hpha_TRINITY_DN30701_c0_g1::TRINITY_DN30701_c0_g1_i1::g.28336::m.28336